MAAGVGIYSAAKTVADCFKFRNQIGTKTAIEGLKDAWKKKRVTTEDLYRFARVCRVLNVMRPFWKECSNEAEGAKRRRVGSTASTIFGKIFGKLPGRSSVAHDA